MNWRTQSFKFTFAMRTVLGLCLALCLSAQAESTDGQTNWIELPPPSTDVQVVPTETQIPSEAPTEPVDTQAGVTNEVLETPTDVPANPTETQATPTEVPAEPVDTQTSVTNVVDLQVDPIQSPAPLMEVPTQSADIPVNASEAVANPGEMLINTNQAPTSPVNVPVVPVETQVTPPEVPVKVPEKQEAPPKVLIKPNETITKPVEASVKPPVVVPKPVEPPAKAVEAKVEKPVQSQTVINEPPTVPKSPSSVFVVPTNLRQGRDPFFPDSLPTVAVTTTNVAPVPETSTNLELMLQGISGTSEKPLAIINNITFGQGEQRFVRTGGGDFRIRCVEIKAKSVIVQIGSERRELRLRPTK